VVIGQAKGVISGRAGVDLAGAFSRLQGRASARYSRRRALAAGQGGGRLLVQARAPALDSERHQIHITY
jgi:hypothetical protein